MFSKQRWFFHKEGTRFPIAAVMNHRIWWRKTTHLSASSSGDQTLKWVCWATFFLEAPGENLFPGLFHLHSLTHGPGLCPQSQQLNLIISAKSPPCCVRHTATEKFWALGDGHQCISCPRGEKVLSQVREVETLENTQ